MHCYSEYNFREQVGKALEAIRKVLHVNRHPQYASDVTHQYEDKYMLVEFLAKATLAVCNPTERCVKY
jgi:hypothetical protein